MFQGSQTVDACRGPPSRADPDAVALRLVILAIAPRDPKVFEMDSAALQLLLDLVENGVSREDAYRVVQAHAMKAWKEGLDFHQLVLADKEITGKVPRKQIEHAFDLQRQLKNVDKIFARVFGGPQ